ncbi:hypothetical protein [Marinobacterium litorale]|uniref:hypothetical protein n=1 Tax=Marinobacterium litorale TaxID=404770 RepID=UPI000488D5D7|nr:hypothetical protein [Marinobacterium litorale]
MTAAVSLSRSALALLLRLLNSPTPGISGSVLHDDFPSVAAELLQGGFLSPAGSMASLPHDDTGFAELTWCSESRGFRYFSTGAGWVTVAAGQVKRYLVDTDQLMEWLRRLFDIEARYQVTTLHDSVFWYLGITRIGAYRVNLYFVRRLELADNLRSFLATLKQESGRTPAIIVSASERIPPVLELPLDVALVPLQNLLVRTGDHCSLDHAAVLPLLRGCPADEVRDTGIGLRFSTDYRQVHWNGEAYKLTKKQAAVVEALHREGGRAHKDLLRAEAETNEELHRIMRNKVDGKWVPHPLWNRLIKGEGNGYYFFDQ